MDEQIKYESSNYIKEDYDFVGINFIKKDGSVEFVKNENKKLQESIKAYFQPKKSIYTEIIEERARQEARWGQQNHDLVDYTYTPEGMNRCYEILSEERAKYLCESSVRHGNLTWGHIIVEELVEALCAKTVKEQREELIQCGAVIVAMIESLDRNGQ